MAIEIERKFLVKKDKLPLPSRGTNLKQGYIPTQDKTAVRVRIAGEQAFLTIKGKSVGAVRSEFEYPIPLDDAEAMLNTLCTGGIIEKVRYEIPTASHVWEVDIFSGANEGLCLAEIELRDEQEEFTRPDWVSKEVTEDSRYYNANLIAAPYRDWKSG